MKRPGPPRRNYELNLTMRCQAHCTNCNRLCNLLPDRTEDLSYEQVRHFWNEIARLKKEGVVLVHLLKLIGGEPTMHPEFPRILALCLLARENGLVETVRVVTNGVGNPQSTLRQNGDTWKRWKPSKKRHLPFLWSPKDLGIPTKGPCRMATGCGANLDVYGWLPCGAATGLVRLFQRPDLYRDEIPTKPWGMEDLCVHCIFSLPFDQWEEHLQFVGHTDDKHRTPTPTFAKGLEAIKAGWDMAKYKKRWGE